MRTMLLVSALTRDSNIAVGSDFSGKLYLYLWLIVNATATKQNR